MTSRLRSRRLPALLYIARRASSARVVSLASYPHLVPCCVVPSLCISSIRSSVVHSIADIRKQVGQLLHYCADNTYFGERIVPLAGLSVHICVNFRLLRPHQDITCVTFPLSWQDFSFLNVHDHMTDLLSGITRLRPCINIHGVRRHKSSRNRKVCATCIWLPG